MRGDFHMNRSIPCAAAVALLAACTPEPTYAVPDNDQALSAIRNGIRADLIDAPPRHAMPENPEVVKGDGPHEAMKKVGGTMLSMREGNDRASAQRRIDSMTGVDLGPCEWEAVDTDEIYNSARPRIEGKIAAAYRCEYRLTVMTNLGSPVTVTESGYFYKQGDEFLQAKIEKSSWED